MDPIKKKVVILGDSSVGKTAFINRFVMGVFTENTRPTISAAYKSRSTISKGLELEIQFWDTAGEEKYRSLAPIYVQDAFMAILMFDVTNRESYQSIELWYELSQSRGTIPVIILGNKNDLDDRFTSVSTLENEISEKYNSVYLDISAKLGMNVEPSFQAIVDEIEKLPIESKAVSYTHLTLPTTERV